MQRAGVLSSRHNPRFRAAMALRDAGERRARGLVLVDGAREIHRALRAGVQLREAWVARPTIRGDDGLAALEAVTVAGAPIVEATPDLMARLAYGDRYEGLVGVFEAPVALLERLSLPVVPLVAVVVGVEKPGNLGAIVRSADGAGLDAVIVADPRCDPWNPNAIRSSVGTVFTVPLAVDDAVAVRTYLRAHGLGIVTARPDATAEHVHVDLRGPLAIVLGSEAEGLGQTWVGPDIRAVRIPMLGAADSLNVAASAAVLFYEARRQRGL